MKKILSAVVAALIVCVAASACKKDKDNQSGNGSGNVVEASQIVGKWDVQCVHLVRDDYTSGEHYEIYNYTGDTIAGPNYDSIGFNSDGTSRWYMSESYRQSCGAAGSYRNFDWYIGGDSLFVCSYSNFFIKEADSVSLVIESYRKNGYPDYGHHVFEETECWMLKRKQQ